MQSGFTAFWDQEEIAESGQEILQSEDVRGQISFEHVAFGYEPGKELIQDLNIRIPAASKVAIVGANWCWQVNSDQSPHALLQC